MNTIISSIKPTTNCASWLTWRVGARAGDPAPWVSWEQMRFLKARLFFPLITSWSFRCCGGWRYLHLGFSRVHRPWKLSSWEIEKGIDHDSVQLCLTNDFTWIPNTICSFFFQFMIVWPWIFQNPVKRFRHVWISKFLKGFGILWKALESSRIQ